MVQAHAWWVALLSVMLVTAFEDYLLTDHILKYSATGQEDIWGGNCADLLNSSVWEHGQIGYGREFKPHNREGKCNTAVVPNLFGTRDQFCARQFFHGPGLRGCGFGMIQARYIYYALYFHYYYISST